MRSPLALAVTAGVGLFAAVIFWPAGTLDWPAGWVHLGMFVVYLALNLLYLARVNPELIERRMRIGKGTKGWDIAWLAFFTPTFLAIYAIAGWDAVRFGWSSMSPWYWLLGLALFVPGAALFAWSMGVNPFFEKTVRIQTERGHHVIDSGPYQFVRHPGYLGLLGWIVATPLLLGSWWAFVPALLSIIGLVVRTALEDRTLRAELAGYEDYAGRVRFRLLPGVW